jgi:phosphatidylserine synthase
VEKPSPSSSRSYFGVKDVFTTVNALGGAAGIFLCVAGRPFAAGVAVMLGFLGDLADGWVARKLGTQNQFGAEYDTIADHLAHCIAPGAILYTVYRDAPMGLPAAAQQALAMALGATIMVAASVRHARNVVRPVEWKGAWAGLPRTILGFMAIGFANARLVPDVPGGYWLGVGLVPLLAVATLTYWPFANHRIGRRHFPAVRLAIASFFVTTFGMLIIQPEFFFDVLFFWTFGYAATSWIALTADERSQFRRAVRAALAEDRA